jgi:hypothetical protein
VLRERQTVCTPQLQQQQLQVHTINTKYYLLVNGTISSMRDGSGFQWHTKPGLRFHRQKLCFHFLGVELDDLLTTPSLCCRADRRQLRRTLESLCRRTIRRHYRGGFASFVVPRKKSRKKFSRWRIGGRRVLAFRRYSMYSTYCSGEKVHCAWVRGA